MTMGPLGCWWCSSGQNQAGAAYLACLAPQGCWRRIATLRTSGQNRLAVGVKNDSVSTVLITNGPVSPYSSTAKTQPPHLENCPALREEIVDAVYVVVRVDLVVVAQKLRLRRHTAGFGSQNNKIRARGSGRVVHTQSAHNSTQVDKRWQ